MAKKIDVICKQIQREREKLNAMPLGNDLTLQKSRMVDELINEYYKELLWRYKQLFADVEGPFAQGLK